MVENGIQEELFVWRVFNGLEQCDYKILVDAGTFDVEKDVLMNNKVNRGCYKEKHLTFPMSLANILAQNTNTGMGFRIGYSRTEAK
ncbi:hypothetical protein FRX31_033149, partial [Thalictrum thalictroides]